MIMIGAPTTQYCIALYKVALERNRIDNPNLRMVPTTQTLHAKRCTLPPSNTVALYGVGLRCSKHNAILRSRAAEYLTIEVVVV